MKARTPSRACRNAAVRIYAPFCSFAEMHIHASAARTRYWALVCHRTAPKGMFQARAAHILHSQGMRHETSLHNGLNRNLSGAIGHSPLFGYASIRTKKLGACQFQICRSDGIAFFNWPDDC